MAPTRRQFVAGAGAALVAPAAASAARAVRVGVAPDGREAIGVIGTILQDARQLTGFGYVTHVAGMKPADLFTNPATRGAGTARLRWHAEVTVSTIDVMPQLFYGTGTGRLRLFFSAAGGAVDGQPDTFVTGTLVARYTGTFRNVQIVYAPDQAVTEIIGELVQRESRAFTIGRTTRKLGRNKSLQRLVASGPATRTEPTIPRSTRYVAGGISFPA
jgi:hypothetical protein